MNKFEEPAEVEITPLGLQHRGRIYSNEKQMMREIGGEIMEDLEDLKNRPIAEVAKKYGVVFVHGTHPNFIPTDNSPLKQKTPWAEKVRIVLEQNPEISCSTIKPGDDSLKLWAGVGLIIKNGVIKSAHAGDLGSKVDESGERFFVGQERSERVSRQIPKAIGQRADHYNEFIVKDPEVAGLYLDPIDGMSEENSRVFRYSNVKFDEFFQRAKEMNLPGYLFYKGEFYEPIEAEIEIEVLRQVDRQLPDSDTLMEPDPKNIHTLPVVDREQYYELQDQGIFISDQVVLGSTSPDMFERKVRQKVKVIKLGKKAVFYSKEVDI